MIVILFLSWFSFQIKKIKFESWGEKLISFFFPSPFSLLKQWNSFAI